MQVFKISGMTCGHCVGAVKQALQQLDDNARIDIDLDSGELRIDSALTVEQVTQAIHEEGYQVQSV